MWSYLLLSRFACARLINLTAAYLCFWLEYQVLERYLGAAYRFHHRNHCRKQSNSTPCSPTNPIESKNEWILLLLTVYGMLHVFNAIARATRYDVIHRYAQRKKMTQPLRERLSHLLRIYIRKWNTRSVDKNIIACYSMYSHVEWACAIVCVCSRVNILLQSISIRVFLEHTARQDKGSTLSKHRDFCIRRRTMRHDTSGVTMSNAISVQCAIHDSIIYTIMRIYAKATEIYTWSMSNATYEQSLVRFKIAEFARN